MSCHPILALTPKEREAIALVREGLSNQQIADLLKVKCRTVESHLCNASYKLGAKNRLELVLILDGRLNPGIQPTLSFLNNKKLLKSRIKELHKQGCSDLQIGERLGHFSSTIHYHLTTMGLK